ncbi:MAG: hypothetical protein KC684_00785 [Candidatus Omnitrophica bacterium]|nr:hypothetical protein [Candidatus Omnitrophota bacterium]
MSKGLRFFAKDYNNIGLGGTVTASSADGTKEFAFDGLISTKWLTSGEGTDGDAVSLEMDYGTNRQFDCFYVYNTNIEDIVIAYWNGSSWVDVDSSNAAIVKSSGNNFVFAKMNSEITTQKVRITGSNTIDADNEKYVTQFLAFAELGQFEYFPTLRPRIKNYQNKFKTSIGKNIIIDRGEVFEADIVFKSHVNANDIALATTLLERKETFYIWPNGGDEDIFSYSFKPYRFKDIFKVSIVDDNNPEFTKNYYKSGYNNIIKVVEAA